MRVYIFTDLEGATGVVDYDYGDMRRRRKDREFLIKDVNAAVTGAFDAGAQAVTVYDGHGKDAVQLDKLDSRATLIKRGKPESYIPGLDSNFTQMALVGFHAMAGAKGVLSHTHSLRVRQIKVNGQEIGEIGLNFLYAQHYAVDPVFISGDDKAVLEAKFYIPNIEGVEIKRSISERCAECLSPELTYRLIHDSVYNALLNHKSYSRNLPLPPYDMEVTYKKFWVALPRYFLKSRFNKVRLRSLYTIIYKDQNFVQLMNKFIGSYKGK